MAKLTEAAIQNAQTDDALLKGLFAELSASVPAQLHEDLDELVARIQGLPPGLRAMAATHKLDVSMALDDLGWHFANWHHHGYCRETSLGLKELEAGEVSEIFDRAYSIASHQWEIIGELLEKGGSSFAQWYRRSELNATLAPLNRRLWELLKEASPGGEKGIFRYWVGYARKYPERVVSRGC
jgi:hypothetical protein